MPVGTPQLTPQYWGKDHRFLLELLALVQLVRAVFLACLRIVAGGEGANRRCDCDGYRLGVYGEFRLGNICNVLIYLGGTGLTV